MNKPELKNVAPYLPYGVILWTKEELPFGNNEYEKHTIKMSHYGVKDVINGIDKLILRPLTDLTKEIEIDGEKFVPIDKWDEKNPNDDYIWEIINNDFTTKERLTYPYYVICQLLEWHFDVFGLIPEDLAININTLK